MARDRRLGELHDVGELRHLQLVPLEEGEEAQARRIGERSEARDDVFGRGGLHP
jgi:hypothetical protein